MLYPARFVSVEPLVFSVGGVQLIVTVSELFVDGLLAVDVVLAVLEPVVPDDVLLPEVVSPDVAAADVPLPGDVL
jgi:hypothetical protein